MRVLWFTNIPMPQLAVARGMPEEVVGGWMSALLEELRISQQVTLAVVTVLPGETRVTRQDVSGVAYYGLPGLRRSVLDNAFVASCDEVIAEFRPDVVHVHGTEEAYGLYTAVQQTLPPAVVSIQGLIHVCQRHVGGNISLLSASRDGVAGVLSWLRYREMAMRWRRSAARELRILKGNRFFLGRTEWDRAHVWAVNPGATYVHCGELLRAPFYEARWNPENARPRTIFCAAAHSPLKGFHTVLDALSLLRGEFPDLQLRVAAAPWDESKGHGYYGRYLKALIDRRRLAGNVVPLPRLGPAEVAAELGRAAVFVIPSFVENSPNSLAEAMLVGVPCVTAMVGGITSMVDDGQTALGFQPGDAEWLAYNLRRLFTDGELCQRLSTAARSAARTRHEPRLVVAQTIAAYRRAMETCEPRDPRRA